MALLLLPKRSCLRSSSMKLLLIMGRTSWKDEDTRKLLVILNEEKVRGVSKFIWTQITKNFNAQTGNNVTSKQVQNHYNDQKEKYKCWEELQSMTGIAFDPRTGKVDVAERSLERYNSFIERNQKYGVKIIKQGLPNQDELCKLFDGRAAHGVGGCFSPAMANGPSYLTTQIEDLTLAEGSGDADDDNNIEQGHMSGDESKSPPRSIPRSIPRKMSASRKRKSEDTINSIELKRRHASFDSVIQLLSGAGVGSSSGKSKAEMINAELTRMEVSVKKSDEYFVSAMGYLSDEKHASIFLSLQSDTQKWIYMKRMEEDPSFFSV